MPANLTHYQVLGVAPDASAEDIKQAWRRASSAAHPDKAGGSADAQAATNKAYEVLSNPERRQLYDATGVDDLITPIEAEARMLLAQMISAALDKPGEDLVGQVYGMLAHEIEKLIDNVAEARALRDNLISRRESVLVDAGDNMVQQIIDDKVKGWDATLVDLERVGKMLSAAHLAFSAYRSAPLATLDEVDAWLQSDYQRQREKARVEGAA
nr:J domain-containing protein [uncultured Roseateles sp.]